ncbi:hypothetical protein OJF2_37940 [Aquisphaera giovannonii]|uniref:Chaperone protein DnaJ n=1 Tax=Aquisphaera giovannonii TaxID=406548 RepID=A0A5B9W4R7_9BACT|nr:hypothetical protein OJF2_37940 [Aquisphaera giovannonii]
MNPIPIFVPCPLCECHGRESEWPGVPRTRRCEECRGPGLKLSTDGQVIRGLLRVAGLEVLMPDA